MSTELGRSLRAFQNLLTSLTKKHTLQRRTQKLRTLRSVGKGIKVLCDLQLSMGKELAHFTDGAQVSLESIKRGVDAVLKTHGGIDGTSITYDS